MRILSYGHSQGGCWWIRIKTPLGELQKKHAVILTDGMKKVPMDGWQIVVFNNILGDIEVIENGQIKKATVTDIIEGFKKTGAKIVYDTDDAQDLYPLEGEAASEVKENLDSYFYLLKNADLITVTTPELKKHVEQYTDKTVLVLPNSIDPDLFPERKKERKIKIGFTGSPSHVPDLELVWDAIQKLKEKYDVYFEILGFQYKNCKYKKPVPVEHYYEALAELGADIGICPLKESGFNTCKSPLKFLEYSSVGTMVLASKRHPYLNEMKEEWLVEDNEWYEKLEKYILDKGLRERTLKEQQEWVRENRDIKKNVKQWEEAYRNLIK